MTQIIKFLKGDFQTFYYFHLELCGNNISGLIDKNVFIYLLKIASSLKTRINASVRKLFGFNSFTRRQMNLKKQKNY